MKKQEEIANLLDFSPPKIGSSVMLNAYRIENYLL